MLFLLNNYKTFFEIFHIHSFTFLELRFYTIALYGKCYESIVGHEVVCTYCHFLHIFVFYRIFVSLDYNNERAKKIRERIHYRDKFCSTILNLFLEDNHSIVYYSTNYNRSVHTT
jgi:hypothetical protein